MTDTEEHKDSAPRICAAKALVAQAVHAEALGLHRGADSEALPMNRHRKVYYRGSGGSPVCSRQPRLDVPKGGTASALFSTGNLAASQRTSAAATALLRLWRLHGKDCGMSYLLHKARAWVIGYRVSNIFSLSSTALKPDVQPLRPSRQDTERPNRLQIAKATSPQLQWQQLQEQESQKRCSSDDDHEKQDDCNDPDCRPRLLVTRGDRCTTRSFSASSRGAYSKVMQTQGQRKPSSSATPDTPSSPSDYHPCFFCPRTKIPGCTRSTDGKEILAHFGFEPITQNLLL